MNELLAKLTNLSYELFGVILPGVVASVFLVLWWVALGDLAPYWTVKAIPAFSLSNMQDIFNTLGIASGIGVAIPLVIIWYFLGQIILWVGRSGPHHSSSDCPGVRRVLFALRLKTLKPTNSFDEDLKPLLVLVSGKFAPNGMELQWRHFYPVAKSFLARTTPSSLVATYQNKYTFHRSIATASVLLFWFSTITLTAAVFTQLLLGQTGPHPNWVLVILLPAAALVLVWGFSDSYMYHWKMFGNTIITESYSILCGPRHVDAIDEKSPRD